MKYTSPPLLKTEKNAAIEIDIQRFLGEHRGDGQIIFGEFVIHEGDI